MQRRLCEVRRLCPGMFDGINPNTPYRWKRSAPLAAPLGRKTSVTRRHDTAQRAHRVGVRRLVPQLGDDQDLGARMSRRRGTRVQQLLRGVRMSKKKPAMCVKELHNLEQQHANRHSAEQDASSLVQDGNQPNRLHIFRNAAVLFLIPLGKKTFACLKRKLETYHLQHGPR